ncbi:DUF3290 family protein [Pseudostreptobacillus hongkongensis]|uniref:DUF3290 family protein n=1 Tax=Pseudostreptobacillus hongkongensis TaxID=1162717 RepID=UPI00082E2501|nr:DUF3290 family protein [Pseudostreptobacillus hongkongensis]
MRFYSYEFLRRQISVLNLAKVSGIIFISIIVIFSVYMYYRKKKESKYRELVIITMMLLLLLICSKIEDYRNYNLSNHNYYESINLIEQVSRKMGVIRDRIYITRGENAYGTIIKINNTYYKAIKDSNSGILFEQITLVNPDVELVEVDK